jgi:hypothetical protein
MKIHEIFVDFLYEPNLVKMFSTEIIFLKNDFMENDFS